MPTTPNDERDDQGEPAAADEPITLEIQDIVQDSGTENP